MSNLILTWGGKFVMSVVRGSRNNSYSARRSNGVKPTSTRRNSIPIWSIADDGGKIHFWYAAGQTFRQLCDDTSWVDRFALNRKPDSTPCRPCLDMYAKDGRDVEAFFVSKSNFPPRVRLGISYGSKKPSPDEGLDMATNVSMVKFGEFCEAPDQRRFLDRARGGGPPSVDYTKIIQAFRTGTLIARDEGCLYRQIEKVVNKVKDEHERAILSELGDRFNEYWLARGTGAFMTGVRPQGIQVEGLQVRFGGRQQVIGVKDEYHREILWLWVKRNPPSHTMKNVITYTLQLYRDWTLGHEEWQAGVVDVLNKEHFLESDIDSDFPETYFAHAEAYLRIQRDLQQEKEHTRETKRQLKPPHPNQGQFR